MAIVNLCLKIWLTPSLINVTPSLLNGFVCEKKYCF